MALCKNDTRLATGKGSYPHLCKVCANEKSRLERLAQRKALKAKPKPQPKLTDEQKAALNAAQEQLNKQIDNSHIFAPLSVRCRGAEWLFQQT